MVLEEATSPQDSATYSEALPSSDLDPYESGNPPYTATRESQWVRVSPPNAQTPVYVNLNNLPRPFSPFGQRNQPQALSQSIQETCKFASGVLHRPVTQEEADAFGFHLAKSIRVASYGEPIGFAIAMAQAYRTNADLKFPLWSPMKSGRFTPDRFGPFRGVLARMQWQALRIGAYGTVGAILGSIFFSSYAMSIGLAGRALDPRLKEFTQAIKTRMEQRQGSVSEEVQKAMGEADQRPRQGETEAMARQRAGVQRQQRQAQSQSSGRQSGRRREAPVDDMSPTGGAFEDEFMGQESSSDTGLMSDGQARQQSTASYEPERSALQTRMSSSSTSSSASRQQSGSAWERLRQGAMSGGQPTRSSRSSGAEDTSRNTSDGDSFTFSQQQEDKQLARGEAQKEFDARVEREREGKDFDEGRRGGGWRR